MVSNDRSFTHTFSLKIVRVSQRLNLKHDSHFLRLFIRMAVFPSLMYTFSLIGSHLRVFREFGMPGITSPATSTLPAPQIPNSQCSGDSWHLAHLSATTINDHTRKSPYITRTIRVSPCSSNIKDFLDTIGCK